MALKVLGQAAPAATTNTNVYTVPAGKSAVVSTLTITNRAATASTVRVAVRPGGAAVANQHWVYYDLPLPGTDTFAATIGMSLAAGDVVTVWASTGNVSVSLFGDES